VADYNVGQRGVIRGLHLGGYILGRIVFNYCDSYILLILIIEYPPVVWFTESLTWVLRILTVCVY